MTAGRRILASVSALLIVIACGGGRETGAPATGGQTTDTTVPPPDTAAATAPDTAAAVPDTTPAVAQAPPAKPPAPTRRAAPRTAPPEEPAPAPAPAPAPIAEPADTDTAAAAQPAETTQATAAATEPAAPLRDAYHQPPRDTVSAEVYEGWKQYNLNCARCHGEDVLGTTIAPHLIVSVRPGGAVETKEAFVQTVCAGRPEKGMPSWCALGMEMEKINQMYAYVKGRSQGEISPGRPARRE